MANPGALIRSFPAAAAIGGRRIVKFVPGGVAAAAGATDRAIGVADTLDVTAGMLVDVIMDGSAEVVLGGAVSAGQAIAANAARAAVAAAAGAGNVAIGFALADGVAGDFIDVALSRHAVV